MSDASLAACSSSATGRAGSPRRGIDAGRTHLLCRIGENVQRPCFQRSPVRESCFVLSLILHRPKALLVVAVAATAVLSACSSNPTGGPTTGGANTSTVATLPRDAGHIHGLAIDGTATLLATHSGMWRIDRGAVSRVGTTNVDFMGFTVAGSGQFYSSGHPNSAGSFQQPVGLIESTDGGVTWEYLSRGGESDFHALAASPHVIYGYDGALQRSSDGKIWQQQNTDVRLLALAVDPAKRDTVLATTATGLQRSTNGGTSFAAVPGAPTLALLSWSDPTALWGIDPNGAVYFSSGTTGIWHKRGSADGAASAIAGLGTDQLRVATETGVYGSTDGGRTFTSLASL